MLVKNSCTTRLHFFFRFINHVCELDKGVRRAAVLRGLLWIVQDNYASLRRRTYNNVTFYIAYVFQFPEELYTLITLVYL
jgi:hypothetical protein